MRDEKRMGKVGKIPAKAKNEKFPCHRGNRTTLAAAAGSGGGMTKLAKLEQHYHLRHQDWYFLSLYLHQFYSCAHTQLLPEADAGKTILAKLEQHTHSEKQSLDKARKAGGPPPEGCRPLQQRRKDMRELTTSLMQVHKKRRVSEVRLQKPSTNII